MWNILIRIGIELLLAVFVALLLRRFVGAFALVKGKSMMDTLRDREVMFVLRYGLFGEPRRFDVVICRYPKRKGLFVKRIIAMPNERISMREDVVYINGEAIAEDFPRRRCMRVLEEVTLGPDEYFVMGDNRPISQDSRKVGPLKRSQILALAVCVILPIGKRRRIRRSEQQILN